MKQFILTVTRWPIAMFELIPAPGVSVTISAVARRSAKGNRIVAEWNVFAGLLCQKYS